MQVYSQTYDDAPGRDKKDYWTAAIIFFVISFILLGLSNGSGDGLGICGSLSCCMSIVFGISALAVKQPKSVMMIQPPQQMVPQNITIQNNLPRQQHQQVPSTRVKENIDWISRAKNFEMARNWEEAATAYENAGLFAEAGRIRQQHLENNQPVVQIGQVGNTVLNDSVMIAEGSKRACASCGEQCDADWNICPNCTNPL